MNRLKIDIAPFTKLKQLYSKYFLLFFLVGFTFNLIAQEKKADKHFSRLEFKQAAEAYEKALKDKQNNNFLLYRTAESYRKLDNYTKAEQYYSKISSFDDLPSSAHLYYGQILRVANKPIEAKKQFQLFAKKNPKSLIGKLALQSIDNVQEWTNQGRSFTIDTISGINTAFAEFSPVIFKGNLVFVSDRGVDYNGARKFDWNEKPFLSIYKASNVGANLKSFADIKDFSNRINTIYHDGPIAFNKEQTEAFYTRVSDNGKGKLFVHKMKIYTAKWDGNSWIEEEELPFNSDAYSAGHPACSQDGKRLFFSSDMPGGFGGMDLYYVVRGNGKWSKPINLGREINTAGDEVFPYFQEDKLYFSSNGLSGYGGFDIFESYNIDRSWTKPMNLKSPINSSTDDFGIYFINDNEGYFSSNRYGGKGMDDIYYFYTLSSLYTDSVAISGVFQYKNLPQDGVKLNLLDEDGLVVQVVYTDKDGFFKFNKLPSDKDYFIKLDALDDSKFSDASMYITNAKGDKLALINKLKNGSFKFKTLDLENITNMGAMAEDETAIANLNITGQIFKKLPGDYTNGMMVYLIDDSGIILDSAFADEYGKFNFKNLPPNQDYIVKLKEEDSGIKFAIINKDGRIVDFPKLKGENQATIKQEVLIEPKIIRNSELDKASIIGLVEVSKKRIENMKIHLLNVYGDTLATTYSSEKGEFQFNKLAFEENYIIRISDDNPAAYKDAKLYAINTFEEKLFLIDRLKDEDFVFRTLTFDQYSTVQLYTDIDELNYVSLYGNVYEKNVGDLNEKTKMIIYDEKDNIKGTTTLVGDGSFEFHKLLPNEKYSFKLVNPTNKTLSLVLQDKEGKTLLKATQSEANTFTYPVSTAVLATFEKDEYEGQNSLNTEHLTTIFGQLYAKNLNDFQNVTRVYLLNENGDIVDVVTTDKFGRFKFKTLDLDNNYSFRLNEKSDDLNMVLFDKDYNIVANGANIGDGIISFNKEGINQAKIDEKVAEASTTQNQFLKNNVEEIEIKLDQNFKGFLNQYVIYYDFDSYEIEESEKKQLDNLANKLIRQSDIKINIISYTDPIGSIKYNQKLSIKRSEAVVEYLTKKGVDKNQLFILSGGEKNQLFGVNSSASLSDMDRNRINRRSEFKIKN